MPNVTYDLNEGIATVTMDDGKVNALSPQMLTDLHVAVERAATDGALVVLIGRENMFSAGFDLRSLTGGGKDAFAMLRAGFELSHRLLSHPKPVVISCSGHAVAMGVFLLLSGDYRIGAAGPYRIVANEVSIGLPMPRAAIEICRQRLTPAHFNRAVILAETYSPDSAVAAGFLDEVVEAPRLPEASHNAAARLAKLNMDAHAVSKLRVRDQALQALRTAIDAEFPA
jgi:enoyl-CoA hydratase